MFGLTSCWCQYRNICACSSILFGHVDSQVDQTVGVIPFVVIPRHKLHETVIEGDASADIENQAYAFAFEIAATISANSGFIEAPPTRKPSMSGCAESASAFAALAEPPYWMRMPSATAADAFSAI